MPTNTAEQTTANNEHWIRTHNVIGVTREGVRISVDGRPWRVTSWRALRAAADQDAGHHGHVVDAVTRQLAERYRRILGIACAMWHDACRARGDVLEVRHFEVGCRFGSRWGLARPGSDRCVYMTGVLPFGCSAYATMTDEAYDMGCTIVGTVRS